jgi:hypothetical protein
MTLAVTVAICLAAPTVPAPASNAAVVVARTFLSPEQYSATLAIVRKQITTQMGSATAAGKKEMDFLDKVIPTYDEMIDFQSGLFSKYYTAAELEELAKFYETPVGKKTLRLMPEIMQDTMGFVNERVQREMPELIKASREREKARATKK